MGVPSFFRWLINSCPQAISEAGVWVEGEESLNPQVNNLYLDLNGIIHPCTHPPPGTNVPNPKNEEQMFDNIRRYLDLLIGIVRPQSLIYFAIDGVAPKAKMNQQRARRFRAAQENVRSQELRKKIIEEMISDNYTLSEETVNYTRWDHNVITPGTTFLERVSNAMKAYIVENLLGNELWKDLKIVFSDASVPKEGEHKILEFIRQQRTSPGYDPNTRHCIYGADADLIILSLSTHEPHFYIIRERLELPKRPTEHKTVVIDDVELLNKRDIVPNGGSFSVGFSFVKIAVVRQFLDAYMKDARIGFKYNLENVIDDFVFLCFLVGNDFLPHLPGFNIRQGGIDIILGFYREKLGLMGGYLTREGEIDLALLQDFLKDISRSEYALLQKVEETQNRAASRPRFGKQDRDFPLPDDPELRFKELLTREEEKLNELEGGECIFDQPENYKENYYIRKFGVEAEDYECFVTNIRKYYIEGLVWNMRYYYQGCCSWKWFFPYYYAPLVSDLCNFADLDPQFELGSPFRPFEQLLSVLPPYSAHALPQVLSDLMRSPDSEIIDFYPPSFVTDLKGKAFSWLGEVILPFIDNDRLLRIVERCEAQLTKEEKKRNITGSTILLTRKENELRQIFGKLDEMDYEKAFSLSEFLVETGGEVVCFSFELDKLKRHICDLLKNVKMPKQEFYIKGRINGLINEFIRMVLDGLNYPNSTIESRY